MPDAETMTFSTVLEKAGYEILSHTTTSQPEITERLRKHHYDLIVTNVRLALNALTELIILTGCVAKRTPIVVVYDHLGGDDVEQLHAHHFRHLVRGNHLMRFVATVTNALNRKRSRRARRRLQATVDEFAHMPMCAFDSFPGPAFIKDATGHYIRVNDAWLALTGFEDRGSVFAKTSHDIFPEEVAALLTANDNDVLRSGATLRRIETVVDNKGAPHSFFVTKYRITPQSGLHYVVGFAQPINEFAPRFPGCESLHSYLRL